MLKFINNKIQYNYMIKYLLIILLVLSIFSPVLADPGAGLVYVTESSIVSSKQETCVSYGLYNPFDVDSQIALTSEGAISDLVTTADSEFVEAFTNKEGAKTAQICFKAPEIRNTECLLPVLLCKHTCDIDEQTYSGQVLASPVSIASGPGSGSAVGMSIAAPYRLIVRCEESDYNYIPLIFIIVGIFVALLTVFIIKYKKKKFDKEEYKRRYEYWQRQHMIQNQQIQQHQNQQQNYFPQQQRREFP